MNNNHNNQNNQNTNTNTELNSNIEQQILELNNKINELKKEISTYDIIDPIMYIGGGDVEKIYRDRKNILNDEINICKEKINLLEIKNDKNLILENIHKELAEKNKIGESNKKIINKTNLIIISCFSEFSIVKDKNSLKIVKQNLNNTNKKTVIDLLQEEVDKFKRVNFISNAKIFLTEKDTLNKTNLRRLFLEKEKDGTEINNSVKNYKLDILSIVLNIELKKLSIETIVIVNKNKKEDHNIRYKYVNSEIELVYITLEEYCTNIRSHLYNEFKLDPSKYNNNSFLINSQLSFLMDKKTHLLNNKIKNSVVIFKGYIWEDIIDCFKTNNLIISGGSNNVKHLVNPLEYKLSNFIQTFFEYDKGYNSVVKSVYKMPKILYKSKNSEIKNKEIIIENLKNYKPIEFKNIEINVNKLIELVVSTEEDNYVDNFFNSYCEDFNNYLNKNNEVERISLDYKDDTYLDYNFTFEEINDILYDSSNNNINNLNDNNNKEGNLNDNNKEGNLNSKNLMISIKNNKEIGVRKYHTRCYSTSNINNNSQNLLDNNINTETKNLDKSSHRSLLTTKIKSLIDNIKFNTENTKKERIQIQIEKLLLDHETQYLNNLIKEIKKSTNNVLTVQIIRDWESKLKNKIIQINDPYTKNNKEKLKKEIEKNNIKGILQMLIFSIETSIKQIDKCDTNEFNNGKLINIFLKLIVQLLSEVEENKMKKSTLVMRLMDLILRRVPASFPILSLTETNPLFWENKYNELILNMSEESKISIGSTILDLILEEVDIFYQTKPIYDKQTNKRHNYISIKTEYLNDLIDKCFNPLILPMVSKPRDWVSEFNDKTKNFKFKNGGYYTEKMQRVLTTKSFIHHNSKLLKQSEESFVQQNTINFINKQKFRINTLMLNFLMTEFNDVNSTIFKGYNTIKEVPIFKYNKTPEEEENLRLILAHNSRYFLNKRILDIAYIFQNVEFYIPVFMDFRGRIYPYPSSLEYQGTSIARSLIEFNDGCLLTNENERFVYQYLANTAGKSKLTLANKEKWSEQFIKSLNIDYNINCDLLEINKLFKHPKVLDIVNNNDEAPLFISCLFSFIKVKLNQNKKFHTPICFDATCSGLQHLSALFLDVEIAQKSNVIGNIEEIPQDLYKEVAETVISKIESLTDPEIKSVLSKIQINRKLMKKPVMTVPYNVSMNTLTDQLVENKYIFKNWETLDGGKTCYYTISSEFVKSNVKDKVILTNKQMGVFAHILHQAIYNRFPSLKEYKKFLDELIRTLLKLDKNDNLFWITPAHLKINIAYHNYDKIFRSKNILKSKKGGASISLPQTSLDYRRNLQAFMPNFIHSMDAANIHLLIENIQETNINLYTIHDCFATTPNYMELLNKEIKIAFISLYFDSQYIKIMYDNFMAQISSKVDILEENKNGETLKFFLKFKNGEENEKIYIPNIPDMLIKNWDKNKNTFIKGIRNSLYFIN